MLVRTYLPPAFLPSLQRHPSALQSYTMMCGAWCQRHARTFMRYVPTFRAFAHSWCCATFLVLPASSHFARSISIRPRETGKPMSTSRCEPTGGLDNTHSHLTCNLHVAFSDVRRYDGCGRPACSPSCRANTTSKSKNHRKKSKRS